MSVAVPEYAEVVAFLESRSAERLAHVQGSLVEHLDGTYRLLKEWGNPPAVCYAGLCHAVYSTDGFAVKLLEVGTEREELALVIGSDAESLVYFYASCDRQYLYPLIRQSQPIRFRDRFDNRVFVPDERLFARFMELTFANELDMFRKDSVLVEQHRGSFGTLFGHSKAFVSQAAFACFVKVFGEPDMSHA
jgi:hypothetical protein